MDSDCQLYGNIIAIGVTTRAFMVDHTKEIPPTSLLFRLFMSIRQFYEAVTCKMLTNYPLVSSLMFLNPRIRGDLQPSILTDQSRRFPYFKNHDRWDQLQEMSSWTTRKIKRKIKEPDFCIKNLLIHSLHLYHNQSSIFTHDYRSAVYIKYTVISSSSTQTRFWLHRISTCNNLYGVIKLSNYETLFKKDHDEYIYISTDVSDVRFIMSGNMCIDMQGITVL